MNKKRTQPVRITLPPGDGITGKSSNPYQEYKRLRKHSPDFNIWVKRTYGKQGAKCYYCMCDLTHRRINVEHIMPLSRGGQSSSNNMVISCAPCNKDKGSKVLSDKNLKVYKKRMQNTRRKNAIEYKIGLEYQEELAHSLSWI